MTAEDGQSGTLRYMDELPSTEFRKRFARLTEPTVVTVNGHVIGVWTPGVPWKIVTEGIAAATQPGVDLDRFNSRPFTPVPKKGK